MVIKKTDELDNAQPDVEQESEECQMWSPKETSERFVHQLSIAADRADSFWARVHGLPLVRSWRIVSDIAFLTTGAWMGVAAFIVIVVMAVTGAALSFVLIGLPILAALIPVIRLGARMERSRIRAFLGIDIPSPYHDLSIDGNLVQRIRHFLRHTPFWRDTAYMLLLFPVGLIGGTIAWTPINLIFNPLIYGMIGTHTLPGLGWITIGNPGVSLVAMVVGFILLVPFIFLINFAAILHGRLARALLAPRAEDRLIERVEELTESRSAVMRAMHLERRRIERDLHDGAQQQLVALAMDLGRAREKIQTDPRAAEELLASSHEDAKQALTGLRELVRGIHPAVLTDRGLDAAISAIAGHSRIPVSVEVDLPDRQPEEVEGTAYFVVVEALTNVAKHSQATAASVTIRRERGWLRIVVADNGIGGADPAKGTGLRGLGDRIMALEGKMTLVSPPGEGTTLQVDIPCA